MIKSVLNNTLDYYIIYILAYIIFDYTVFSDLLLIWNSVVGWKYSSINYKLEAVGQLVMTLPCFYIIVIPNNKVVRFIDTHYKIKLSKKNIKR